MENLPLPYQSLDKDGKIIDVNQAWLDTLKYSKKDIIGKWFGEFLSPEFRKNFDKLFSDFKKKGIACSVDLEMIKKDGSLMPASFDGKIFYDEQGNFKETLCVFKDITEQKKVEKELAINRYYLTRAQEIGQIGTWELDTKKNILVWTDENYRIFGLPIGTELTYEVFLKQLLIHYFLALFEFIAICFGPGRIFQGQRPGRRQV